MAKSHQSAELLGQTVEYDVHRSSEATEPRIDVDIHGVNVIIPDSTDVQPQELLKENAVWIVDKKREYDKYREQIPDREFEPGETFPYLGDQLEIVVEQRSTSEVVDSEFQLAEHHVEQTSIQRALETLYRREARNHLEARADHFAEQMNVEYDAIEIRNQRTKWGSCSTTGTLGLNWRLMMAPPEMVDYIVIHELAHLRESNHGSEFWSLVAEFDPEYEAHSEWLSENSSRLVFTEDDL
jgi:predicted metal-dependent hydrolase